MQSPLFSNKEYLTSALLNGAFGTASANVALTQMSAYRPGLIHPEAANFVGAGLVITGTYSPPFALMSSAGVAVQAHGINTGADTQSYATDFTPYVPAGTAVVTAFLIATVAQIQQNSYQVIGPPPGHPDYNPNFQPYTAYASTVDTLAITATTGVPDGITTFEIGRTVLTAASTAVTAINTVYQPRWGAYGNGAQFPLVSAAVLTATADGFLYTCFNTSAAFSVQLPLSETANGQKYGFANIGPETATIIPNGADGSNIYGAAYPLSSGVASVPLTTNQSVWLQCTYGRWITIGGTVYATSVYGAATAVASADAVSAAAYAIVSATAIATNLANAAAASAIAVASAYAASAATYAITSATAIATNLANAAAASAIAVAEAYPLIPKAWAIFGVSGTDIVFVAAENISTTAWVYNSMGQFDFYLTNGVSFNNAGYVNGVGTSTGGTTSSILYSASLLGAGVANQVFSVICRANDADAYQDPSSAMVHVFGN